MTEPGPFQQGFETASFVRESARLPGCSVVPRTSSDSVSIDWDIAAISSGLDSLLSSDPHNRRESGGAHFGILTVHIYTPHFAAWPFFAKARTIPPENTRIKIALRIRLNRPHFQAAFTSACSRPSSLTNSLRRRQPMIGIPTARRLSLSSINHTSGLLCGFEPRLADLTAIPARGHLK